MERLPLPVGLPRPGPDRAARATSGSTSPIQAYELHPEIPPEGRAVRPGGRLDRVLAHIGAECAELGHRRSGRRRASPNTRHVLEAAEVVRLHRPEAFAAFDDALARRPLGRRPRPRRPSRRRDLVVAAGAPADVVADLVADGVGTAALTASMAEARAVGVMATPAWWVDDAC